MEIVGGAVGIVLIALVIWEVFRDLFHPGDSGALSDWLGRWLFSVLRRYPSKLPLSGPLTIVLVILLWVLGLVLGFALVYVGSFPAGFRTSTGEIPTAEHRFLQSLYFSLETLITLGYGDLVPEWLLLRFLAAGEGLIGFGLLTASVSSIVMLYPALSRMRNFAKGVSNLVNAQKQTGLSLADSGAAETLAELARQVTNARIDLIHFPVIYYFATKESSASPAHWGFQLVRFAKEGLSDSDGPVRISAATLDCALTELASLLAEKFLHMKSDDRNAVFTALAKDHLIDVA